MSRWFGAIRITAGVTMLGCIALLVAGCGVGSGSTGPNKGAEPHRGGTLTLAQRSEVITLDPLTGTDISSAHVISQILEPLTNTSPNGKVEPLLAASWKTSADDREWTFQLQEGVTFSNRKPMTSADVVFSLDEARKSETFGGLLEPVTSVSARSPSTVVIKTKQPMPALLSILAVPAMGIVPKDRDGKSAEQFGQDPIGTGPFELASWSHGESLTLKRNPHYWQHGKPYLDGAEFETIEDDNSRIAQLRGGQLDVIEEPALPQLATLENTPGINAGVYGLGISDYLVLNLTDKLFADPRVREAINLSIDRESVVQAAISGFGKPGGSWLPPNVLYADESIEPVQQDLAKARQLVTEAVKSNGGSPKFSLIIGAGETYSSTAAQIIQQDLKEIGLEVELQPRDPAAALSQEESGEFDAYLGGVYSTITDPSELMSYFAVTEGLYSGGAPSKFKKLAEDANTESDPAKRRELYYELQQDMAEELAIVMVDYRPFAWAMSSKVIGLEIGATGTPSLVDAGLGG